MTNKPITPASLLVPLIGLGLLILGIYLSVSNR
jgi:hypothetical protein